MQSFDDLYFPKRSFKLPTSEPSLIRPADYSYWLKLALWSEHEALFLLLGAHPPGEEAWLDSGGPFHGNRDVEALAYVLFDLEKIFESSYRFRELTASEYDSDDLHGENPPLLPKKNL